MPRWWRRLRGDDDVRDPLRLFRDDDEPQGPRRAVTSEDLDRDAKAPRPVTEDDWRRLLEAAGGADAWRAARARLGGAPAHDVAADVLLSLRPPPEALTAASEAAMAAARARAREGGDFRGLLEAARGFELRRLKQQAAAREVEVVAARDACAACAANRNRAYRLEVAMRTAPLPVEACSTTVDGRAGWCRCRYTPVRTFEE